MANTSYRSLTKLSEQEIQIYNGYITYLDAIHKIIAENDVKVIINCAAYTNVEKAESDQDFCEL